MNVTLVGMSGAGKSYIGKKVADRLGLGFLDIDRMLLEPVHGKPLQDILDQLGDTEFMRWEERMMIDATKGKDGLLISTPGSVAYEKGALEHLRDISSVVYLKIPFSTIEKRVGDTRRGIVGLGTKTLRELYDERTPSYEKYAHHIIEPDKLTADETVQAIVDFLDSRK
jgi:shikimate kinase